MRLVVSVVGLLLTGSVAVAQCCGSIWFHNGRPGGPLVDAPFFDEQGVRLEGPTYVAQLYAWKEGEGYVAVCSPVPFGTNGYFRGGIVAVPFTQPREYVWVQVRAWRVEGGASFEEAALAGAWTGVSEPLLAGTLGDHFGPPCPSPLAGASSEVDPAEASDGRIGQAQLLAPPYDPALLVGLKYPGAPLIVRQPQPPHQAVRAGDNVSLSVVASTGVAASYQWYRQPSARPDGVILGATNATFTSPPLYADTVFWVTVTTSAGTTISERATAAVTGSSVLRIKRQGRLLILTLEGFSSRLYQIQSTTDLLSPWTPLFYMRPDRFGRALQLTNDQTVFFRAMLLP